MTKAKAKVSSSIGFYAQMTVSFAVAAAQCERAPGHLMKPPQFCFCIFISLCHKISVNQFYFLSTNNNCFVGSFVINHELLFSKLFEKCYPLPMKTWFDFVVLSLNYMSAE